MFTKHFLHHHIHYYIIYIYVLIVITIDIIRFHYYIILLVLTTNYSRNCAAIEINTKEVLKLFLARLTLPTYTWPLGMLYSSIGGWAKIMFQFYADATLAFFLILILPHLSLLQSRTPAFAKPAYLPIEE